jgi:acetyl-CoA carboxylase biotin carboxyl carrier protein
VAAVTDEPVPAAADDTARATGDSVAATGDSAAATDDLVAVRSRTLATETATALPSPHGNESPDSTTVRDDGDVSLLALIDRLAAVLERSDLSELEVESGDTALVLRKPITVAPPPPAVTTEAVVQAPPAAGTGSAAAGDGTATAARPSVKAPLTGIFYGSPSPGSPPYVQLGGDVAVGQVIGLIEAMKLFNEIKSDLAGRVVRVVAESGQLVKARQPLIEVEQL